MADRSRFQRHVGLAIAYDAWQHWQVTGDLEFAAGPGAELVFEIARFFASAASWDDSLGRYRIAGVVGPDEFHDGYPWSAEPGVADNAYTNVMTAWLLWRAGELAELLTAEHRPETAERLGVDGPEVARWQSISRTLHVPFHGGVISQFAGYERLETLDLDAYRSRYGNIGRLDLILEAEGDTVSRYQVSKQADVLMLLYLLSAEELRAVFGRMGYSLEPEMIRDTVDYYAARVTHGSSLSRVVHAWVLARADRQGSWQYFRDALAADVADSQGGTTREGIHLGAMAGTADILQRCYAGLEVRGEALWLHPLLPAEIDSLRFKVWFRGSDITVDVDRHRLRLEAGEGRAGPVALMVSGEPVVLRPGQVAEVALDGAN
jgi:trehalose/maltose hydrolase-like predicted phosphorylase